MTENQIDLYQSYHAESNIDAKFSIARDIIYSEKENKIYEYCMDDRAEDFEGEIWKPVSYELYKEHFEVSNLGRLKRLFRYVWYRNGTPKKWKERILKPSLMRSKHTRIRYSFFVNNSRLTRMPHQVVLSSFSLNPNRYVHINHIDGNQFNNHILNLEYCTPAFNEQHSYKVLGKWVPKPKLDKRHLCRGKVGRYSLSGELIEEFSCMAQTAEFGYIQQHVGAVINGTRKTHANSIWKLIN